MKKILVVDDMAICREPIAEALRGRGYDVVCAASGEEALCKLRDQQPDIVLLDMAMPGLDGLAVLRTIRRNPEWRSLPVIMLTDKADRECVVGAASHKVQGYLLKSNFSIGTLLARVEACFTQPAGAVVSASLENCSNARAGAASHSVMLSPAPSVISQSARCSDDRTSLPARAEPKPSSLDDLKPIISKAEVVTLVNKGLELHPLGAAIHNVLAATATADCSAEDVAKALSQDQVLSIRILKLANSSAYSRGRGVDNVKEAVQRVGIAEVRRMVMTLGVVQQFDQASIEYFDARLFWEHSTACGLVAAAIARARKARNPDDYFLWGMLHDIGRLILLEHVPKAYASVWEAAERLDLPLEAVEVKLTLVDHCEVLERALEHWKFPRDFIAPVVNHHRPLATIQRLGPQHSEAAATIALADRVSHALLLGSSGNDVLYPLEELSEFLSLPADVLAAIATKAADETRDLKLSMLSRALQTDWPDTATQIKGQFEVRLRPIYLGPSTPNAIRLFFDRGACPGEGPPNVAIAQLREIEELSPIIRQLEAQERKLESSNIPLLLIVSRRDARPVQPLLQARRAEIISMPIRIAALARSVNKLLAAS